MPAGLFDAAASQQFCCNSCRIVYRVLNEQGLQDFYRIQDDSERQQARTTQRSYAEFDDASFQQQYCREDEQGQRAVDLYLDGVHCTACVWLVEKLPQLTPGVSQCRLDLGRRHAALRFDPQQISLSRVAQLLDSLGYPAYPYRGVDRQHLRRAEERRLLIRIAVAGAAAGNVMLMAFALYAGVFGGMRAAHVTLFRWASLAVALPAVLWSGAIFFRGALGALRAKTLHMDLPIALGIGAGLLWGAANTIRDRGEVYFDSVTILVFLLLVGRWLQLRQQRDAAAAAEMLFALTPRTVRLLEDGRAREVPLEAVVAGARVEVRAGDTIPVDGDIAEGRSRINASLLSGEARPQEVEHGDRVFAGTLNLDARLEIAVIATGQQTRVGQLMQRVEEHARRRAPVVRMADRVAGWFVGGTLALATLTLLLWLQRGAQQAVEHAMALLIVTCPCALGLATPLAVAAAIGRAARQGILIKGGDAVERLARPGLVVLDKTGTVTEGRLALVHWHGKTEIQPLVAALEAHSAHPMARALVAELTPDPTDSSPTPMATEVHETHGSGIEGRVGNQLIVVGKPAYVRAHTKPWPSWADNQVAALVQRALTPVLVAADGRIVAAAGFGDPLRADAQQTLETLQSAGWKVALLSGDHPRVVSAVGRQLGIAEHDCHGGATPEEKLSCIQRLAAQGPTIMVGDGVNDAAALAAATCGISVSGAAEASFAAADVFIGQPGLQPLNALFDGARATVRTIRRNFLFSLTYNAIGVTLAMTGLIGPLWAAVLMPLSSLTVVTNSFRSRSF